MTFEALSQPSCIHATILTWKPEARPLAGRFVSPSQGARFAKPAGLIISVSVAEHLERLFRIRYRPIMRGSVTQERSSHRLLR
jgi:hypothetical protein